MEGDLPVQVFSQSGTAGCCPRLPARGSSDHPTVSVTLTIGEKAMTADLTPEEAKALGLALVADADRLLSLLPWRPDQGAEE